MFPPNNGFENIRLLHGYFAVIMFAAGFNSKALGVSLVAALGLLAAKGNIDAVHFVFFVYVPAYVVSAFRN